MSGPMTANTVPNQDDIIIKQIVFFNNSIGMRNLNPKCLGWIYQELLIS